MSLLSGNSGKLPIKVNLKGCDKPPCKLIKGNDAEIEVEFSALTAVKDLRPKVVAKIAGISVPYELPGEQKDGCKHLKDTKCPLEEGEDATYVLTMPVMKSYPSISLEIELQLLSETSGQQFCFKVDCRVSSS